MESWKTVLGFDAVLVFSISNGWSLNFDQHFSIPWTMFFLYDVIPLLCLFLCGPSLHVTKYIISLVNIGDDDIMVQEVDDFTRLGLMVKTRSTNLFPLLGYSWICVEPASGAVLITWQCISFLVQKTFTRYRTSS